MQLALIALLSGLIGLVIVRQDVTHALFNEPYMNRVYAAPKTPKDGRGTKRDFAVSTRKIQILSKEVCYKVS